jgi:hypothetical protein
MSTSEGPPRLVGEAGNFHKWGAQMSQAIKAGGYYEYKYSISHEELSYARMLLDATLGGSDPFPSGIVDSIYYDSTESICLAQCLDGAATKCKFRIRGYGDGTFNQLHLKQKVLSQVAKLKSRIEPLSVSGDVAPEWRAIAPLLGWQDTFAMIANRGANLGLLIPSMRVRYQRFRYRQYDMRVTLDTNIEVFAFPNGLPFAAKSAILPNHVLEVKTTDPRPHLPLLALLKLRASSFSKFKQGALNLNFAI